MHDLPPGARFFMRMDRVMEVTIYDTTRQHDSRVRRLFDTNMDITCPSLHTNNKRVGLVSSMCIGHGLLC